jgi:hypothetical protein
VATPLPGEDGQEPCGRVRPPAGTTRHRRLPPFSGEMSMTTVPVTPEPGEVFLTGGATKPTPEGRTLPR